ncbi:Signal transducer regulating beta-lactamase production, contains metallopeptidase domain [Anaerovirgula multivorans]|uniref:Signal transducer regulating beta-lactamase production, contains metallopeptidase domain n=1 Tax=Anaerovirgula multivorans TaxID=312168 RepID=A0A239HWB6_9FIRM|nr:M56 family metallopeptidase [Anaerovirgula multivorans]SNS85541.1 Signal transducer regulating beta-lactamase production, contains metallopeptidase domain [Anaerovirgula multivorans]
MLENFFISVLNMSITASVVAIIIMILRRIFKNKLPKTFTYGLWAIVLIRLLIPFSFSSMFSLFNVMLTPSINNTTNIIQYVPLDIGMMHTPAIDIGGGVINQQINSFLPPATPYNSANPMQIIMFILSAIWIMIGLGMFLFSSIIYLITVNRLKTATLYHNNNLIDKCSEKINLRKDVGVYMSDRISTPVVCGFIRPRIILPLSIANNNSIELEYIITHELIHIKRYDYIIKPFSLILLYIHWFNPLMWLSYILAYKDMELSCDERVLSASNKDIRSEYATALLNFSVKQNNLFNGGLLAFGEKNIITRVKGIISYKKPTFWISMIAVILIAAVSFVTIANPKQDLSFLNKDNALSLLAQQNSIIAKIEGKEHAIPSHASFIKFFESNKWKEKKLKSPLELVSEMEFEVNEKLTIKFYSSEPLAMILYDEDFRYYTIPRGVYTNLHDYALSYPVGNGDIGKRVEEYLTIIMSFPNTVSNSQENVNAEQQTTVIPLPASSNPQDYIDAHQQEYQMILEMGEEALHYMLAQFQVGEARGLKSHIMMALCIDILGDRNNVAVGTYNSPEEWYEKLNPYTAGIMRTAE